MLNEKQKIIQEKLEDIYRVTQVENIEGITSRVTGKKTSRQDFLENLIAYTMGYCHQLIEHHELTTSEDHTVSYVLETLSNEDCNTLEETEFLIEWAINKLALTFGLDLAVVKKVE